MHIAGYASPAPLVAVDIWPRVIYCFSRLAAMKRVVVLLVVVASACGGAAVPSTSTTNAAVDPVAGQASVEDVTLSVVDAIVAVHGEEGGFDAVIWALERGYSGDQLIEGALDGRLQADGKIADSGGGTETPAGSPLGSIELPDAEIQSMGATAVPAANRIRSVTWARFRQIPVDELEMLTDSFYAAINDIIAAILGGYSPEQVIELILLGGSVRREYLSSLGGTYADTCYVITDSTGQTVVPRYAPPKLQGTGDSEECQDLIRGLDLVDIFEADEQGDVGTPTSSLPAPPFPWTYEGTVNQHIVSHTDFGDQGAIEFDNSFPVTITINADGTVSGTVGGGSATVALVHCTGTASSPGGDVSAGVRDIEPWQVTGTYDNGAVRFDRLSSYLPSDSDVEGTYAPSDIQADWENDVSFETCNGVGNQHYSVTESFTLVRTEPPAP